MTDEHHDISRAIIVPCPHCVDGFTSSGDRHARTRTDVCKTCGGAGKLPLIEAVKHDPAAKVVGMRLRSLTDD